MHKSQSLFYLTTALHVSGVTITHLQQHKTTVTTASGNRYTVLVSAAIVVELIITYSECVPIASVILHSKHMGRILLPSVACMALPYFSTLPHKRHDVR
jgi:hypothetical protein